jgi:hypothetical protein
MFYVLFVLKDNLVLQDYLVLLAILVLIRPLGLAKCLDLNLQDVHGTWDAMYLKDAFNF